MLYRGTVTRVTSEGAYALIPDLGEDAEFGPLEIPSVLVVGNRVLVGSIGSFSNQSEDLVIVGQLFESLDTVEQWESPISAGNTSQYWRGDKTWQTLPLSVSTESLTTVGPSTTGTTKAYRRGGLVIVNVNVTTTADLAFGATIFTLPVGYRPLSETIYATVTSANTEGNVRLYVTSAGPVIAEPPFLSGVILRGSFSFPL